MSAHFRWLMSSASVISPASVVTCFTWVVFAGLAAHAAGAQTLNLQSGDSVTVSGAGTHGIYQGQPISSPTHTYTGSGQDGSAVVSTSAGSQFTLDSGGTLAVGSSYSAGLDAVGASVTINGGTIQANAPGSIAVQSESGILSINQGDFSGDFAALLSAGGSTTLINGGTFSSASDALAVFGGTVQVRGGTFTGGPGGPADLVAAGGVLDLFGTFNGYSNGSTITSGSGTITGTLLDGEAIRDTYFVNDDLPGSRIEFITAPSPVPEASTPVSFGLLALGLGGRMAAARKKNAAV